MVVPGAVPGNHFLIFAKHPAEPVEFGGIPHAAIDRSNGVYVGVIPKVQTPCLMRQISLQYSRMDLSDENLPMRATLRMEMRVQCS